MNHDILAADDEEIIQLGYERYLKKAFPDSTIHIVGDGQEAIDTLDAIAGRGGKVDLVLTDNDMPKKAGMDVIDHVKARYPSTRVIMIAGAEQDSEIAKNALERGASVYRRKPVDFDEFPSTVASAIDAL